MKPLSLAGDFEELLEVGMALSRVHNLEKLLDLILLEARCLTHPDAGTLYLVKGDRLVFKVGWCESLIDRLGETQMRQIFPSLKKSPLRPPLAKGGTGGFYLSGQLRAHS